MTTAPTTELERYEASTMSDRMEYARMIASAGDLVPAGFHDPVFREGPNGVQLKVQGMVGPVNPGKVFLAFEYGAMLGLHPLAALMGIHVIEGKPAASAGLISSLVRTAGHRLRVTTEGDWEDGTFKATAELVRADDPDFTFRAVWTRKDAERASLLSKDNWKNYPRSMAKARAITEVAREGAEEALLGVHYTPEELGATVDANGEVLVVQEGDTREEASEHTEPAPAGAPKRRAATGRQGTKRKAAPAEPVQAVEDVVDAEVVTEEPEPQPDPEVVAQMAAEAAERQERERIAAEQEAAQRARDEAEELAERKAKHDAEVAANQARLAEQNAARPAPQQEHTARPYVDNHDGQTYATQEELDAAIRARVQAKKVEESLAASDADAAATEPDADEFAVAVHEAPEDYERQAAAATTLEQLRDVWDRASATGMSTAQRLAIIKRKAALSGPVSAEAPADDQ